MRIDHIAIWAEDIECLREFYARYFNMSSSGKYINHKKNFSSYFLSFSDGGARIELMTIPGKDAPASRGDLKGLAHFSISSLFLWGAKKLSMIWLDGSGKMDL